MEFEDYNPEEFLFGKLPEQETNLEIEESYQDNPRFLNLMLFLTGIIYGLIVSFLINYFSVINFSNSLNYAQISIIITGIAFLTLASTLKNYVQLHRCGPFLKTVSVFSLKFMLIQSIFTSIFLVSIHLVGYFILTILNFVPELAIILISGVIGFFVYSRIISNLPLITAGLGIGLFPSFDGLINTINNFQILYQIVGKKDYQLAIFRLLLITSLISSLQLPNPVLSQLILITIFSILYTKWEIENGSSITIKIWTLIQKMSPASLPNIEFNQNISFILESNNSYKSLTNNDYLKGTLENNLKRKNESKTKIPTKQELTPIAARSINRIASSILNES